MKKYITLLTLALLVSISASGQFRVSYSLGYGEYGMSDMQKLLNASLSAVQIELPPRVRIVDNFPGYVTHTIDATYHINRHEFGLKATYMTTGGKIAYSDYSGKYYEKLTLNGYRLGALYRFHFLNTHLSSLPFSLFGELSPAVTFTSLKYDALLSMPDYDVNETNTDDVIGTDETGYSVQPLIGGQLWVMSNLFIHLSAGYDFEFGAKLSTTNNMFRADWTGFRVNGGVGFSF